MKAEDNQDLPQELASTTGMNPLNFDLASQIAFSEFGLSRYWNDEKIAQTYGITLDQLNHFKKSHRDQIDQYKDEHKYGKFKIMNTLKQRLDLHEACINMAIQGNEEGAAKIQQILKLSQAILPNKELQKIASIYKDVDLTPVVQNPEEPAQPQINIKNYGALQVAQQRLDARKKEEVIDLKSEDAK